MNDTKKLDVETCISGPKEIVLDTLVEAKKKGKKLGIKGVRDAAGITELLQSDEASKWLSPFTRDSS